MRNSRFLAALGMTAVVLSGCAAGSRTARGAARPSQQVSDRLFFGLSIPDGGMVSDSAWRVYLKDVVTPALPEGFTVYRTEGQWLDPRGVLVKEPGMVVEVHHPAGVPADSVFERIATEYRLRFRQDAVLRATAPAQVWLYEQPSKKPD